MTKPLDQLGPDDFRPLVGERFTVVQNEGDFGLSLVEVRPLPPHARRGDPFALVFQGPPQPVLPQRIHSIAHAAIGTLAIFLVPVQGGGDGVAYEAVFN